MLSMFVTVTDLRISYTVTKSSREKKRFPFPPCGRPEVKNRCRLRPARPCNAYRLLLNTRATFPFSCEIDLLSISPSTDSMQETDPVLKACQNTFLRILAFHDIWAGKISSIFDDLVHLLQLLF